MPQIIVTDHAVVRYLERVHGLNIKKIREDILDAATLKSIEAMGRTNGVYTANTHKVRLWDGKIITVIKRSQNINLMHAPT